MILPGLVVFSFNFPHDAYNSGHVVKVRSMYVFAPVKTTRTISETRNLHGDHV